MATSINRFRKKCLFTCKERIDKSRVKAIDKGIALGVLLWAVGAVAEADEEFLPAEGEKIKEVLRSYIKVSEQDFPIVLTAIRQAAIEKVDFYRFTNEISKKLSNNAKISIIEDLFRIAFADNDLDARELGVIKKVSNLFNMTQKDFNNIENQVKKEFGS